MRAALLTFLLWGCWVSPTVAFAGVLHWYQAPPRIAAIELRLPRSRDAEVAADLVPLRAGQRLTRHALRRTVRLLYETGRFEKVQAYLRRSDEGVIVSLVATPRLRLAEVVFSGNDALSDGDLLRASGLERGHPYDPQMVEQARALIRALYRRRGFDHVEVEVETRTARAGLVACAIRIREGSQIRLGGVRFVGRLGLPKVLLRSALGLEVGTGLDRDRIDEALDRVETLLRRSGFLRARVGPTRLVAGPKENGPHRTLVIEVAAGPHTRIEVTGAHLFSPKEVVALAGLPGDRAFTSAALKEGIAAIEDRYRRLGYADVEVQAQEEPTGRGRTRLIFEIKEGKRLWIDGFVFPGLHARTKEAVVRIFCDAVRARLVREPQVVQRSVVDGLLGGVRSEAGSAGDPPQRHRPNPCTVWDRVAYARAVEELREAYRRDGFLAAQVASPEIVRDARGNHARVVVQVAEGPQTQIVRLRSEGIAPELRRAIAEAMPLHVGVPLSLLAIEEGRALIEERHKEAGYTFVHVDHEIALDSSRLKAQVVFRVETGPKVHVGRIIVRGHRHASASLIRSRLTFKRGDLWRSAAVQASQQAIMDLGLFRSATIRLLEPDVPAEEMDVVVVVSEKRPKAVELGFGISTEDGPRLFADYDDLAFLAGSILEVRTKANFPVFSTLRRLYAPGPEWEARMGLRHPRLRGVRTDAIFDRDVQPSYTLTRFATTLGALHRFGDLVSASLRTEMEFDDLAKGRLLSFDDAILTQKDRERLRLEQGQTLLVSVRPGVTVDLRDDPLSPSKGAIFTAGLDWTHDLGIGVPIHFLRTDASASWYLPAGDGVTLALSGRAGRVFALSKDNNTIGPKRFFLGGADSLRGFAVDSVFPEDERSALRDRVAACRHALAEPRLCAEDALAVVRGKRPTSTGGEAFVLFKTEVRFPISGALRGGVFFDLGNLWRDPRAVDLRRLRPVAGAGLRYDTPVGPMALDLGVNLVPDTVLREQPIALHFAIGLF